MRKKISKLMIVILALFMLFIIYYATSLKFNLNNAYVYCIEYRFDGYHGNNDIEGKTFNEEEISSVIKYFNSLWLPRILIQNKGATEWICFKDKDGNEIKGYAFGCGLIWEGNKTFLFGDSQINRIKKILHIDQNEN